MKKSKRLARLKEELRKEEMSITFIEEKIFAEPKEPSLIARSVDRAFNGKNSRLPNELHVGSERQPVRWMKPDGKGGLVTKY